MKRKINMLLGLVISILLAVWYIGSENMPGLYKDIFVVLPGLGIVIVLYVLNRFIIFRKKLELALRHILENNFRTGISLPGNDEVAFLAQKFNVAIDRINDYDRLRENRIDTLNRFINTLNRNILNGIIVLDLATSRLKINKAAQEIFNITQDELSIDSVMKLESNSEFNKMYQDILSRKANTMAADLVLFLPILRAKAAINLKMFAIKDKDEKLNSILCVFKKA